MHLAPRTSQDTDGGVQRLLEKLEAAGPVNGVTRLLGNSPNGFRPYVLMSAALLREAALPAAAREAAILAIAHRLDAQYEWDRHVEMSMADGLGPAHHEAIRSERYDDPALSKEQRAAIELALGALDAPWDDAAWGRAIELWGTEGAFDLVLTTAWWGGFMPVVTRVLETQGLHDLD